MKLVVISDTHGFHRSLNLPSGDVLIHCGDITMSGQLDTVRDFNNYLKDLPFRHRIVVAGNHDSCLERSIRSSKSALTEAVYLQDGGVTIDGIRFYGSPWQPPFENMFFNLEEGALGEKWAMIPRDVDVLITHTPPYGILDVNSNQEHQGSTSLMAELEEISPQLHLFGHIHESRGSICIGNTKFVNAACCDENYCLKNAVWEIEL